MSINHIRKPVTPHHMTEQKQHQKITNPYPQLDDTKQTYGEEEKNTCIYSGKILVPKSDPAPVTTETSVNGRDTDAMAQCTQGSCLVQFKTTPLRILF